MDSTPKHMKRSLTSPITRKMQIKSTGDTTSYQLGWLLQKKTEILFGEDVECCWRGEKLKPLCIAGGNIK